MILLKEFVEGRNVATHTVATYIRRHPRTFEGHTKLDGKKLLLDDTAVEVLNKVYPAPMPEEIWTPAAKAEYEALLKRYVKLLEKSDATTDKYIDLQEKYHKLDLQQKALDTTFRQEVEKEVAAATEKHDKEVKILEGFIADAKAEIEILNKEAESYSHVFGPFYRKK